MQGGHWKAGSRRRKRGAAMVEALVAIPFFMIIFASTVFVGEFYRRKLKSHRESMLLMWQASSLGCDETILGPLPGSANINLGAASEAPGAALCSTGFGEVTELATGSVQASGIIGGYTANASTSTKLICNEKAETGDFDGASEFLWELFAPPEFEN